MRSRIGGSGRDEIDHFAGAVVEFAGERIEAIEQEIIGDDRKDGDRQAERRRAERETNPVRQVSPLLAPRAERPATASNDSIIPTTVPRGPTKARASRCR